MAFFIHLAIPLYYAYIIALNNNVEGFNGMLIDDGMISAGADLGYFPRGVQPPKQFDKQNKKQGSLDTPLDQRMCCSFLCLLCARDAF